MEDKALFCKNPNSITGEELPAFRRYCLNCNLRVKRWRRNRSLMNYSLRKRQNYFLTMNYLKRIRWMLSWRKWNYIEVWHGALYPEAQSAHIRCPLRVGHCFRFLLHRPDCRASR